MAAPKIDPTHKVPFTPLATDLFVRETINVVRPTNDPIPEFGTPHDAISKTESWPHHKFCWQTAVDEKGNCERWFVADPEHQHLYNWEQSQNTDWPTVRQVFVIPREDYDPTYTAYEAPPDDIIPQADYTVTGIEQTRIGDKQLDSLYVSVLVTREYITNNPKISSVLDPQTNEIRQVLEEKVPAGTTGTAVDPNGLYSEVKAINTLWALKTTQFMAGLAGKTAPKTQTWEDVINYSWPDVLLGFSSFAFPNANGSTESVTWRPIWKRQRYDGPCRATITESWSLAAPSAPTWTPMLPREIEYRTPLASVSTPPCLHDYVYFYDAPGTSHPTLGNYFYEQEYQATDLTDWPSTYVASFTVRPAMGGYLSRKVEVHRPDSAVYPNTLTLDPLVPGSAVNSATAVWELENLTPPTATVDYRLDVNLRSDFTGTFLTGFNGKDLNTSLTDTITGLSPQTPYYVRVRALINDGVNPVFTITSNVQMFVAQPVVAYTVSESSVVLPDGGTLAYGDAQISSGGVLKTITITNTGNVAITGLVRTLGGTDSSQWTAGALSGTSVAIGATRTFTLTFAPTSTGAKTANVQVSAANASTQTINLTGTAVQEIAINDLTAGAPILNGGSMTTQITPDNTPFPLSVVNVSGASIAVSSVFFTGPDASVFGYGGIPIPGPLAGGSTTNFDISVIVGTGTGTYNATFNIVHAGTNSPFTFDVTGVVP